jgi:hypothetical protein
MSVKVSTFTTHFTTNPPRFYHHENPIFLKHPSKTPANQQKSALHHQPEISAKRAKKILEIPPNPTPKSADRHLDATRIPLHPSQPKVTIHAAGKNPDSRR